MKASRAVTVVVLALFATASSGADSRPKLGENAQLFVVDVPSGHLHRLTHDRLSYAYPVWSPDGRRIAVYGGGIARGHLDVRTRTGRVVRRFGARDGGADSPPSWSPDGRRIAFLPSHDASDGAIVGTLTVGRLRDGHRRRLARRVYSAAWSPDGRTIALLHAAYTPNGGDRESLRVVPARGGHERTLLRRAESYFDPQWSADGRRILVGRRAAHDYMRVWTIGPRGRRPRRVARRMITADAVWVPRRRRWVAIAEGDSQGGHAWLYRPHRRRRPLSRMLGEPWAWSPTRDVVAYPVDGAIHLVRPGGSHDRVLTRIRGADVGDLVWSPDGRHLAVTAQKHHVED